MNFPKTLPLVVSLVISLLVWMFAKSQNEYLQQVTVPLRFSETPKGVVWVETPPTSVEVDLEGRGMDFIRLSFTHPYAYIDVRKVKPGERTVKLANRNLHLTSNLKVKEIRPESVVLKLDALGTKHVPVVPQTVGSPKRGFTLTGAAAESRVTVHGPLKVLNASRSAYTEPIKLQGKSEGFSARVAVVPPSTWTSVDPETVLVEVNIEKVVERTVTLDVVATHGTATVSPRTIRVKLVGPASALTDAVRARATVDVSKLSAGTSAVRPKVSVPKGVSVADVPRVRVTVK